MSIVRNSTKQQYTTTSTQPEEMKNHIHIPDELMDNLEQEQYTFEIIYLLLLLYLVYFFFM
ncbi:hypothetical protein BD770DRAFT_471200 [Pilaira anomala]|nr:hypothetical protein BD770DRAFT_471200 [Pilaira anomala]